MLSMWWRLAPPSVTEGHAVLLASRLTQSTQTAKDIVQSCRARTSLLLRLPRCEFLARFASDVSRASLGSRLPGVLFSPSRIRWKSTVLAELIVRSLTPSSHLSTGSGKQCSRRLTQRVGHFNLRLRPNHSSQCTLVHFIIFPTISYLNSCHRVTNFTFARPYYLESLSRPFESTHRLLTYEPAVTPHHHPPNRTRVSQQQIIVVGVYEYGSSWILKTPPYSNRKAGLSSETASTSPLEACTPS
ncbi:hypothetical protein VTK26DRAFT_6341 [Humicola hyalothermophila]